LNQVWDPREKILGLELEYATSTLTYTSNSLRNLELYCVGCSITGQADAFFKYEIDTDVIDCIDGYQQANDALAKAGAVFKCIGDAIKVLWDVVEREFSDLANNSPSLPIVSTIMPVAQLGIQVTEEIKANLAFELDLIGKLSIACEFPGIYKCLKNAIEQKPEPGPKFKRRGSQSASDQSPEEPGASDFEFEVLALASFHKSKPLLTTLSLAVLH
jgi:hypothetical protein